MIAKRFSLKLISSKDIFDIVLYGSASKKESYKDLDVAIILNAKKPLKAKLELAQKFRHLNPEFELDVKVIDIDELMDPTFVARQGILAEGISLIDDRYLHQKFGFKAFVYFDYDISKLSYSKKKTLYYMLNGRIKEGMLKENDAIKISNTFIKVPIKFSNAFEDLFKEFGCEFRSWVSLEYYFN
ncbi:MAG: hypothetical protein AABW92_00445 [Nanoarchaeota archaeon]